MKVVCLILFVFIIFTVNCKQSVANADSEISQNVIFDNEKPIKVSLCELQKNPMNYNHKLIEVTGFVSQGYENFSIYDPTCDSHQCIWLEYGGMEKSGTIYCCGKTLSNSRPAPLIVEDVPIQLVDDEKFKTFNKFLFRSIDLVTYGTIQGRFFSGEKIVAPRANYYGGYGHFGICSLLAIQKVVDFDSVINEDLDYGASDYPPEDKFIKIGGGYETLDTENSLDLQRKAESEEREWSFNNPQKVATEYFSRVLKINEKEVVGIKQLRKYQGRFIYYWKNPRTKIAYTVNVSRPYWISHYAKNKRVAWIVIAGYKLT